MTLAGRQMLMRVEMWCARSWGEAQAEIKLAMARNDFLAAARAKEDARDWKSALYVVNRLRMGFYPKESNRRISE